MNIPAIAAQYRMLTPRSLEDEVDPMWRMILGLYFTNNDYIVASQPIPSNTGGGDRFNLMVQNIHHIVRGGRFRKALLVETKGVQHEGRTSEWDTAVEQVEERVSAIQGGDYNEDDNPGIIYVIITIGHYSRFYKAQGHDPTLEDYGPAGGETLEFSEDETRIHQILSGLAQRTL